MRADAKPATPPPALVARGITGITDNLPPGAGVDISRHFTRVFRAEIEARLPGRKTSGPPRRGLALVSNATSAVVTAPR